MSSRRTESRIDCGDDCRSERDNSRHDHGGILAKFSILGRFSAASAASVVPPDYQGLVRHVARDSVEYTVVLFPHDRTHGGVSTSALVRRALERIPPADDVLAVGADFTQEATALLEERGAAVARIGDFGWTDESYIGVRDW